MRFFDTHCHLAGEDLLPQAEHLAERALEKNVMGWALIAADQESLEKSLILRKQLQKRFPQATIVSTAGIHPHDSEKLDPELWKRVEEVAVESAAIGETGLDYYYDHSDRKVQREWFDRHIDLACRTQKPLIIHCRNAAEDVLTHLDTAELKKHPRPGILHCFTEDPSVARKLLDWNFMISFSGIMTFRNAEELRKIAAWIPLDRLLIETDSPWLAPVPQRGKTNEPSFVPHVFECLRTLRSEDPEEIAEQLWRNSCAVYQVKA